MSERETFPSPSGVNVNPEQINVKVIDQDDNEVHFKIKRTMKLGKLMKAFYQRAGKTEGTLKFHLDGEKIDENHTPEGLGKPSSHQLDQDKKFCKIKSNIPL
jgi:small ubiquitin-related modifier